MMKRIINSWVDLERDCPVPLKRLMEHSNDFNSQLPTNFEDVEKAKGMVIDARSSFDLMVTALIQMLYDREIINTKEDRVLFAWLKDDLGRFLKRLDEKENDLILIDEFQDPSKNRVGVGKVSTYAKILKTSYQSVIYETILKATQEYYSFDETDKVKREPKAFLYILFHILQITLSILGGIAREKTGSMSKRGVISTYPSTWQYLMTDKGKKQIGESYKEETGIALEDFAEDLEELEEDKIEGEIEDGEKDFEDD